MVSFDYYVDFLRTYVYIQLLIQKQIFTEREEGGVSLHETPCIVILLPSGIGYVVTSVVCHLTCISVQCRNCTHTAGLGI